MLHKQKRYQDKGNIFWFPLSWYLSYNDRPCPVITFIPSNLRGFNYKANDSLIISYIHVAIHF